MASAVRTLAEGCADAGLDSLTITLDAPDMPWFKDWRTPVIAAGPGQTRFGWSPKLASLLAREAPSSHGLVVHGLWQYHNLAAFRTSQHLPLPVLVFPHGMLDPWALRQSLVKRLTKGAAWPLVTAPLLRRADRLCFTCEEELAAAAPALKSLRFTPALVAPGVEACPEVPEILRREFGETHPALAGQRIILFLGRLHPKKGCDLLVEGFARWQQMTDAKAAGRFHLRMAGPPCTPAYLKNLSDLALEHGLAPGRDISFPGMVEGRAKWRELAAAEAMILPSHQENFGMVVGEALSCGTPALLSDKVNTWPWVKELEAGFVAPDTLEGVVALLNEWSMVTPQHTASLAANAARLYHERFSVPSRSKEFVALITSLQKP